MSDRIFLFDIDGTIMSTHGAGRSSMAAAFSDVFGRADACTHFSFSGMTDVAIFRLGLAAIGLPFKNEHAHSLLMSYLVHLEKELHQAAPSDIVLHPGIGEAIAMCHREGAVGLGTGNVKAGAKLKLQRVALWEPFSFGGFGDDSELRAELLEIGAQRGAQQRGIARSACDVMVIGDTPKDVAAAQAIGARCLAVETGHCSRDSLAGADLIVEDLQAPAALQFLLTPASARPKI
jgi:phosphoglycolate phosphatase